MSNELIPDSLVEEAFHWLNNNADACAEARAHRLYLEEYRKSLKAKIMKDHPLMPVTAQEREAYASVRYIEFLEGLKIAIHNDEKLRFTAEAKKAIIEAWRTASANRRVQV